MSIYQRRLESGQLGEDAIYVKPVINEQYFILPKDQALKELSSWRDITKTNNERRYPFYLKVNKMIYAKVYGGYGTPAPSNDDASITVNPGTKEYFENAFPPNSNSVMGNALTPKQARERLVVTDSVKKINPELEEYNREAAELKNDRDLSVASGESDISAILREQIGGSADVNIGIPGGASGVGVTITSDGTIVKNENNEVTDQVLEQERLLKELGNQIKGTVSKDSCEVPPLLWSNPQDGFIRVGVETSNKVTRKSQVQIASGSAASLRLFKDGGWELKSNDNTKGSSIIQKGTGRLSIKADGDLLIDCGGTFSVKAKDIVMETKNAMTGDIVLNAKHNFRANVGNYAIISAKDITIDAKSNLLSYSENINYVIGNYVRIHEPTSLLIPDNFLRAVNKLTENLDQN